MISTQQYVNSIVDSLALVRLLVSEKENSGFKPTVLHFYKLPCLGGIG